MTNETPMTPPKNSERGQETDESFSWSADAGKTGSAKGGESGRGATGKEWVAQLQSMIDNLTTNAAPVVREIGAKAAELAALAGEKAGPFAQRAADATAQAGTKVAERGRVVAAELRRDAAKNGNGSTKSPTSTGTAAGTSSGSASDTGSATTSTPATDRPAPVSDSPDKLGE